MRYTEHKFTLDVNQTASQVCISVKKGDTARRLLIHLTESGYEYNLSSECHAVFTAKKPDSHVVFNDCTIDGCVIGYDFTAQTVPVAGLVECEIVLYGSGGEQLTSAGFNMLVEDTVYDTETEVESTDEYNALAVLIAEVQALKAQNFAIPPIIVKAEGELISVNDSSNNQFQGLRIFGKSTQDGTPTPSSPVDIVSVETTVLSVTDGTDVQNMAIPYILPGIPVASGGNYIDSDGKHWTCDEIDFARGVYVQRIGTLDLSTISTWVRGTGNGWANLSAFHSSNAVPKAVPVGGYDTKAKIMCNRLIIETPGRVAGKIVNSVGQGMGASIYVSVEGIEKAEALIAYFDENETVVRYALAEPIETALTAEQIAAYAALHTNKPNTTIYNDAGAYMAAEYVADTKSYVDNHGGDRKHIKEVELLAANWQTQKEGVYYQTPDIPGVTPNSDLGLRLDDETIELLQDKVLSFRIANENGVAKIKAIGDKPTRDYTVQITIEEVTWI